MRNSSLAKRRREGMGWVKTLIGLAWCLMRIFQEASVARDERLIEN